jgi:hypothetical protein
VDDVKWKYKTETLVLTIPRNPTHIDWTKISQSLDPYQNKLAIWGWDLVSVVPIIQEDEFENDVAKDTAICLLYTFKLPSD